nr:MAG TPA: hypothetical protein [Caudoviricetes sp.]
MNFYLCHHVVLPISSMRLHIFFVSRWGFVFIYKESMVKF